MSDRDLIARLAHALRVQLDGVDLYSELLAEAAARALLAEAQPQPVEPTDAQLDELWAEVEGSGAIWAWQYYARAVLARWIRPAPEPVSVAERLPTADDCDAESLCWAFDSYGKWWRVPYRLVKRTAWTHWLPHWALPVPQEQADG
jgi:hypothetical protein